MMHNPVIRHACIPSFNGCGTAAALAKFYAALAGDISGCELLDKAMLDEATLKLQRGTKSSVDENAWYQFGMGIVLGGPVDDRARLFGHGGAAGAEGLYDRKTGIALGFVKNRLLMEHPDHPVRDRISEVLALPIRHW
jgi:CubicO group peptidase (beta-lactamase class C family)